MTTPLPLAAASERLRKRPGRPRTRPARKPLAALPCSPRLLTLGQAARYLALSRATVERLRAAGILPSVRIPHANEAGEVRRVLFDREDLDRLVTSWRESEAT